MPGLCRQPLLVNDEQGATKSRAGRRVIGLPAALVQLLGEHRDQQD
jgi:integrase